MNDELRVKNNELGGKMNYRYRTDEEMKDNESGFLERIPNDWKVAKAQYYFNVYAGGTPSTNEPAYWDGDIPWINSGEVQNCIVKKISRYITERGLEESSTKLIPKNTTLLAMTGATCGKVGYLTFDSTANQSVMAFTEPRNCSSKFLFYYLICQNHQIEYFKTGGAQGGINVDNGKKLYINIPSKTEQEKIAKFLDEKTVQFDSIISKKEALIEKLEEAKKSLISEVVTGKVRVVKTNDGYELVERKKEEMKDSGVEWLGDIPKEWDLKRSNYVFKFSKGLSITKENLQDEGIPCINYGEIHSKYGFEVNPKRHKLKCVTEEYFNSNPNALIKYGHFVFADTSEDIQGCGNFSYLNAEDSIFAGYHTIIVRPIKTVSSRYLAYLFDSDDWRIQIRTKVSGIKVFSITQSILKTTKVILPTLSEQKLIVDYLDNKFVNINSMINNMKKQIEKLKEAKQSLISEAVTGKIEILD